MQYATFMLNEYMFGIPIFLVQEFSKPLPVSSIIGHDERVAGLLNIRGKISVVIDLERCLGLKSDDTVLTENPKNHEKRMIILETQDTLTTEAKKLGVEGYSEPLVLLVDSIRKVITIETQNYYPPPAHIKEKYVDGVVKHNNVLLTILSINSLTKDLSREWGSQNITEN